MIDGWKNKGLGPADIPEGDARAFANGKGRELYKAYQERLKTLNACDFGDLLLPPDPHLPRQSGRAGGIPHAASNTSSSTSTRTPTPRSTCGCGCWRRGRSKPVSPLDGGRCRQGRRGCGATPRRRWRCPRIRSLRTTLPVNGARAKAQPHVNICCVGDDDQSIYGWRGAEVDNILRFDKDFPGATIIRLERNYRSTAHILGAASHLIAHNEGRLGKTLFTDRNDPEDAKVNVHAAWDSEEEARAVGEAIEQHQRQEGHNAQRHGDPRPRLLPDARIRGPLRHARPQLPRHRRPALLRAPGNPRRHGLLPRRRASRADDLAFERIVNVPKRGLGEATIRADPRHRPRARHPDAGGRRQTRRKRRAEAEAARRAARSRGQFRPLAGARWKPRRTPNSPRPSWRRPATPTCGRTTARPKRRAGWKT